MIARLPRALAAGVLGVLAGAACLAVAYAWNPGVGLRFDRDLPANATGFYPVERGPDGPFAWTSGRAAFTLPGLDRRAPWTCTVRLRAGRADPTTLPEVVVAVDGVVAAHLRATNEFRAIEIGIPARPFHRGLILSLAASPTFVPGPPDSRELGVMIDQLGCRPGEGAAVLPPPGAVFDAGLAAGLFAGAVGLAGVTAGSAIGAGVLAGAIQSVPLSTGIAPYSSLPGHAVRLAWWISLALVVLVFLIESVRRRPLRNTARFAVVFSAGALYLKLLALLHPSTPLVDAVFHAHRFDWVLGGRFYFTQLSTSATPFPYAIGLYLFAAPWAVFTRDHVTLLRVVVLASEAIAGALLYLMVVRAWGDRLVGAAAVALANLVPVSYVVVGHANLTNAFGQAVSLVTMAAVTLWTLGRRHPGQIAGLVLLATLGFLSHVSTLVLLLATLLTAACFFRWLGGPALRAPARSVFLATMLALLFSGVLYWGQFGSVYTALLARAGTVASGAAPVQVGGKGPDVRSPGPGASGLGRTVIPLHRRVGDALVQTVANVGWPMLALALVGAWRLRVSAGRDRLVLVLAAWGVTCAAFLGLSVFAPADVRYQQDAWEFIGRVEHATAPAAVILAAVGAGWGWRARGLPRLVSVALLLGTVVTGAAAWARWLG